MTILTRLREAITGSRELDFRIHIAVVEDAIWPVFDRMGRVTNPDYRMSDYLRDYGEVINSDDQDFEFTRYTTSIDAALGLVERMMPGWDWEVGRYDGAAYHAEIWEIGRRDETSVSNDLASTPALAILTALFTALEAKDTQ